MSHHCFTLRYIDNHNGVTAGGWEGLQILDFMERLRDMILQLIFLGIPLHLTSITLWIWCFFLKTTNCKNPGNNISVINNGTTNGTKHTHRSGVYYYQSLSYSNMTGRITVTERDFTGLAYYVEQYCWEYYSH